MYWETGRPVLIRESLGRHEQMGVCCETPWGTVWGSHRGSTKLLLGGHTEVATPEGSQGDCKEGTPSRPWQMPLGLPGQVPPAFSSCPSSPTTKRSRTHRARREGPSHCSALWGKEAKHTSVSDSGQARVDLELRGDDLSTGELELREVFPLDAGLAPSLFVCFCPQQPCISPLS